MVVYSAEAWEQRRELITRLYSHEGKTLKQVRRRLAQDGFEATPRMFKTRIKGWELDKNNKEHEMRAIRRIVQRRRSIGKDTVVHLRGRILDEAELRRYFNRKGITDIDSGDIDNGEDEDPAFPQIRVSTPFTELPGGRRTPPGVRISTPIDHLLERAQTPLLFPLPDTFQSLDIVNIEIRNYIHGTYEALWSSSLPFYNTRNGSNCQILEWRTWLFDAMDLIEVGNGAPAFNLLNKVYDRVAMVLREQHPSLLGEILEIASTYKRPSQLQFREQVLRLLTDMANIILSPTHPLTRLLHQLLDPAFRPSLVDAALYQALDLFETTFGPSHEQTLLLRWSSACVLWETAQYDAAASAYRHVSAIRDLKRERRSQISCWADIAEAEFLCKNGRYGEAEKILEDVIQRARYIESSDHVAQIIFALRALCRIHQVRGNLGMEAALQRRAVELSQKYLEIDDVAIEVAMWHQEKTEEALMELQEEVITV